jgi:hypothetical protein
LVADLVGRAALSQAKVCSGLIFGITGSNPADGMDVRLL